jgi:hypothetical protein
MRPRNMKYTWDRVCSDALSETAPKLRAFRIYKALAVIGQRRLSHLSRDESHALADVEEDIQSAIVKHFAKP